MGKFPEPNEMPELRAALQELDTMEGLEEVKEAVRHLIEINQRNYYLEMHGEKVLDIKKNRLFWVSTDIVIYLSMNSK